MPAVPSRAQPTFDDVISGILARCASGSAADVDRDLQTSLGEIATFVGADYAHVVRMADDASSWSIAYEWCSAIAPSQIAAHQQVPLGSWAWAERARLAGEVVRLNRLDELPPEEADARRLFASVRFQSTLQVPIRQPGGRVSACVALSWLAHDVTWDDADVARLRLVGDALAAVMERAPVDGLDRPCHEPLRGRGGSRDLPPQAELAAAGQPHRCESREPRLGGDFLISRTPLRGARGEWAGTVHMARDVTELRESEAALRRANEALQQRRALVVAASLDGVWEWDTQSADVQYSDRFAELLGYAPPELPQTLEFFRRSLHPDDAGAVWAALDGHLAGRGEPYDVECRLRTKSGVYRWFRARGESQRDEAGRPTWMAGALQDIDRQKTAEHALRQALDHVQQLTARLSAENVYLREEITGALGTTAMIGTSLPWRTVLEQIEHVAGTNASVLLLGETGTGKELLARAIHDRSPRRERPLVKVNLAALPASLIESELFGHVKGAFTGALADKVGRFSLADGGTLFLDEIGELEPELQTKLLRVLQEGEFERLGSAATRRVDVRIVAATNRDLRRAMDQATFRADLYYRLAVFPIEVPPLRRRRDDIPLLTWHFIAKKQGRLGRTIHSVPDQAMAELRDYDWPGNVRELENVIERALILSAGSALTLAEPLTPVPRPARAGPPDGGGEAARRAAILAALEATGWKIKGRGNAAERLGLTPSTLRYRLKSLGIQRPTGRPRRA